MPANLENSATATELEKVSFHSNPKERQCKECSNYHTIELISHASKVMLKIPQARPQQYVNHELPYLHTDFSRGRSGGLVFPLFKNFPQFVVIHAVKGFGIVNKAEVDVFLELC